MAHHHRRERNRVPALHNFLKMLLSSNQSNIPAGQETEIVEDVDEPPDSHFFSPDTVAIHNSHPADGQIYVKSPPMIERKESLLTRALLNSPDLVPVDREHKSHHSPPSYPHSNASGHSTAELTSDGDLTSPTSSNTPSPPYSVQLGAVHGPVLGRQTSPPSDPSESKVEANLGRKRCISFACARRADATNQQKVTQKETVTEAKAVVEPPTRKTRLTFACPVRQPEIRSPPSRTGRRASSRSRNRGSPAPPRRSPPAGDVASRIRNANEPQSSQAPKKPGSIHIPGLGGFRPSEETRFHEFASSVDEVDGWVEQSTEYKDKITLNDCMRKENVIRRLAEEAEAEAMAEEEEEDEAGADEEAGEEDDSTIHDFSSDDGNESDNEAGFADSDDESDDGSHYGFWAPSTTTAATSAENVDLHRLAVERRNSNTSIESLKQDEAQPWLPAPARRDKGRRGIKIPKPRRDPPDLPDSTDFVCGTLDEDRPLEAAYISCMEERRRLKHVPIPQDIDPSFPTTDPEDNDDLDEEDEEDLEVLPEEEQRRGRPNGESRRTSPRMSPKRPHSPAPRHSPKRMKSPAPKQRPGSKMGLPILAGPTHPAGVDITGPFQRPHFGRTKSLPRTPNPFFLGLELERQSSRAPSLGASPERGVSRTREYSRGPIDIIQGLERKRQKRKEKFWRQHCRKAIKEHPERRPAPGKGAERMKELGLEVAERFRAYGVGQDTQLVLSV
jgi:hypothetical protein